MAGWEPEIEQWLTTHAWPGNVRELQNLIERGVTLCDGERITLADLALDRSAPATTGTLQRVQDAAAAQRIAEVLERTAGVRSEAARILGVDRTTLYRLMRRLGID